jgi:flagellar hook-length control protein FliK
VVAVSDKALETGSVDELSQEIARRVAEGIRRRFALAVENRKHAEESVEAGREFVQAYVEYVHYVERLHADATSPAAHEPAAGKPAAPATHQH